MFSTYRYASRHSPVLIALAVVPFFILPFTEPMLVFASGSAGASSVASGCKSVAANTICEDCDDVAFGCSMSQGDCKSKCTVVVSVTVTINSNKCRVKGKVWCDPHDHHRDCDDAASVVHEFTDLTANGSMKKTIECECSAEGSANRIELRIWVEDRSDVLDCDCDGDEGCANPLVHHVWTCDSCT